MIFYVCILFLIIILIMLYVFKIIRIESYDPIISEIHARLKLIHPKAENVEIFTGKKSYTINKKYIYLCLKNEKGEYYDMNMLMYVALHELAHVIDEIVDTSHRPEFFVILDTLIEKAHSLDLYDKHYKPIMNYCNFND